MPNPTHRLFRPWTFGVAGLVAYALLAAVAAPSASAQAVPMLVSTEWVAERLDEADLVLLHVGNPASYEAGHLPGARLLSPTDFAPERDGLVTEMPDAADFRALLEEAGVSSGSRIVVYSATAHPQLAARLYLTLEHFGLGERSSLLDGGLTAWQEEGRPVATEPSEWARGSLPDLRAGDDLVADHQFVRARIEDGAATILDARDRPFWTGEQLLQARASRAGRIPEARNVPFRTVVDESGRLLEPEALRALFDEAGVEPGVPVVTYCHVGQQASLLTVAARLLGHEVRIYDGSYEDWNAREELPVVTDD